MKCKASRCTGQRIQTASVPDTMLTTGITALFSLTCALAVANVYSAQPLLDSMAVSLKVSPGIIGSVITATQAGYAIGLLFLVPLGDWLNRKYVVMSQLLLSVAALVAAGLSPNIATLLGAMLIVGLMAVVVQVLVAWVAILATPQKRGQAVGTLTSGIVSGILLSRFISGAIADIAGWRAVYLTAACLMLMIAGIVWKIMPSPPQQPQPQKPTYLSLLKSVFQLYLTEPQLRKRGILALFIFAAFSMLWSTMVMPLTALSLSHTQTGMFGLAGFAGMLAAARAGKWADQGWAQRTTGLALALLTISWLPIGYALADSWRHCAGLCGTGRSCLQPEPDHCRQACSGKPPGWGLHVFLFAGQRDRGYRCHTALFPLGMAGGLPCGRRGQRVCISDLVRIASIMIFVLRFKGASQKDRNADLIAASYLYRIHLFNAFKQLCSCCIMTCTLTKKRVRP